MLFKKRKIYKIKLVIELKIYIGVIGRIKNV